ncbi:SDR family NAD(P)-dependent oxidoreductase [Nocardia cyriacigeorgica]|uniref:SDR family NAD(P)-dependent oxidoreductase n=1 Tax=Nocardia cyriacigeorgica TaxID=135487 RepID=A0A6P1D4M5_9NOCA|nr:SDR family NAD(P)-dependent oxidoreductase [Nocardia cyriacigeorgica]NEW39202.1 SDR family NAD(P)-dependent oxidoreductase [Nocardia cyriacigeorgica]NEW43132.1 SDR family NAD(P)-dependent oxidoreductase [Nocardia cyriacigeorgica]NEW49706.1 SDR family NAD(P)-dependent oxidoreductase [Nocardia cyriacigeorgica]NEW56013.1 SDR family NAD(P)-dependent oxidoreductase [Nocardia cyriacigeorgica]
MKLESGQVAVVTGAANGIGRAIAEALHARGIRVVLADIDGDALAKAAEEIGHDTPAVPTDVADPEQVQRLAEIALRLFGRVDLVFNNAGMGAGGPVWAVEPDDWQRVWAVNVQGVINGMRAFVPHMIEAGRGHVINTSSLAGVTTGLFNGPYTASKHAVVSLTESLHGELAVLAPGVGATVVCPGPVDTQMLRGVTDGVGSLLGDGVPTQPTEGWFGTLTPEQWERLTPGLGLISVMANEMMPAAQAAEIVLAAVEADRLYVTTHPNLATQASDRVAAIVADMQAST